MSGFVTVNCMDKHTAKRVAESNDGILDEIFNKVKIPCPDEKIVLTLLKIGK